MRPPVCLSICLFQLASESSHNAVARRCSDYYPLYSFLYIQFLASLRHLQILSRITSKSLTPQLGPCPPPMCPPWKNMYSLPFWPDLTRKSSQILYFAAFYNFKDVRGLWHQYFSELVAKLSQVPAQQDWDSSIITVSVHPSIHPSIHPSVHP